MAHPRCPRRRSPAAYPLLIAALIGPLLLGCGRSAPTASATGAPSSSPSAASSSTSLSATPSASPEASAASASAGPSAAPPASAPVVLPDVQVENIGMHIGGGPNDAATKAPIGTSVAPHFDELRACWAKADTGAKGGDFGVDLLVPAEGGLAQVSHPRTAIHGEAFRDCVVDVFSRIVFARPRTGRTTVSYSLRFTPTRS